MCFVPSKTTWLLQPLDVFLFRTFKHYVGVFYRETQCELELQVLPLPVFLRIVYRAMALTFSPRKRAQIFGRVGLGDHQAQVHSHIPQFLEVLTVNASASARPSPEQLNLLFPRNRTGPDQDAFFEILPALGDAPRPLGPRIVPGGPGFVLRVRRPGQESVF